MFNQPSSTTKLIAGREITISTGLLAKQANGSVLLECGKTALLATATMSNKVKEGIDFMPLTIEYAEKMYSAGKIPGGFFKREGRPTLKASLTSRLIDRPLRPLMPSYLRNDTQVVVTLLSNDESFNHDALGIIAASAALSISDIPFDGPVGAVLVGYIDGQFIINPSYEQMESSRLNLVVAGTKKAIMMVEADATEVSEKEMLEALELAHNSIKETIEIQEELLQSVSVSKKELTKPEEDESIEQQIQSIIGNKIEENMQSGNKKEIEDFLSNLEETVLTTCVNDKEDNESLVKKSYNKVKKKLIRDIIIKNKIRPDGRKCDEIRQIDVAVNVLKSTHGSSVFTRGETQSLGIATLGGAMSEQIEDGIIDTENKKYYFHYNFPPYSVGETGPLGRIGRRELGHGALAERALSAVIPAHSDFPYTIRLVSEILESNGSSSMASVCSGSLALLDAGVPIKNTVSGIAMGLLISEDDHVILSDIQGLEDHYGDMDFKVAGTENGITALQLDIKVAGLTIEILSEALKQAKEGRLFILNKMNNLINNPNEISENAPRVEYISINPEKVGLLIGPGGSMIRKIEETTGSNVVVTDGNEGNVCISASNGSILSNTKDMINSLVKDIEVGELYEGKVSKIVNFGAFIELVPGKEGLAHISTLSKRRIEKVEDVLKEGQLIEVRVKEIDQQNRIRLEPVTLFN